MIASGRTCATAVLVAAASRTSRTSGVAPAERILPSFDAEWHVPVTSCPCLVSCRVRWVPTAPLAPMISTRMSLLPCPSRRRGPPCQCLRVTADDTRRGEDVTSERQRTARPTPEDKSASWPSSSPNDRPSGSAENGSFASRSAYDPPGDDRQAQREQNWSNGRADRGAEVVSAHAPSRQAWADECDGHSG